MTGLRRCREDMDTSVTRASQVNVCCYGWRGYCVLSLTAVNRVLSRGSGSLFAATRLDRSVIPLVHEQIIDNVIVTCITWLIFPLGRALLFSGLG